MAQTQMPPDLVFYGIWTGLDWQDGEMFTDKASLIKAMFYADATDTVWRFDPQATPEHRMIDITGQAVEWLFEVTEYSIVADAHAPSLSAPALIREYMPQDFDAGYRAYRREIA